MAWATRPRKIILVRISPMFAGVSAAVATFLKKRKKNPLTVPRRGDAYAQKLRNRSLISASRRIPAASRRRPFRWGLTRKQSCTVVIMSTFNLSPCMIDDSVLGGVSLHCPRHNRSDSSALPPCYVIGRYNCSDSCAWPACYHRTI